MNKLTYEQQLERTGSLIYTTVGRSMRPFLRSQEDLVVIERKTGARFSKYDVVLYRRASGKYVLHRIVKVCPDSYTLCGDNCAYLEPGITDAQILGVLTAVIRNGQKQNIHSPAYRLKIRLWCALYWPRAVILKGKGFLSRLKKKLKEAAEAPDADATLQAAQKPLCDSSEPSNSSSNVGMDAVYLMACALHDTVPAGDAVRNPDVLFRFCSQHSITAMVTMALESFWKVSPPEDPKVVQPWNQAKEKAIRKNILLNAERERILRHLDSIGCWYMPLKGSFLQHDYPKFGMRQMSDNDILYDTAFDDQVCDFLCGSGYTAKPLPKNNHDVYTKPPVYNFEMHRRLFSPLAYPALAEYYKDVKQLMVKDEGNAFGYHLSLEDFYVYMTAHAYKHFYRGGIGIRSLADVYVFLDKHGDALSWDYVESVLQKLQIQDYERQCRHLSKKLFSSPQRDITLSDEEVKLLDIFLNSGAYGNRKQAVENALKNMEQTRSSGGLLIKIQYFWRRMFPPLEWMAVLEPDIHQYKWKLIPAYIKRLANAIVQKPRLIIQELYYLMNRTAKKK